MNMYGDPLGVASGAGGGFSGFDWRRMTDPNSLWSFVEQTVRVSLATRLNSGTWWIDALLAVACVYAIGLAVQTWSKVLPYLKRLTRVEPWIEWTVKVGCFLFGKTRFGEYLSVRFRQTILLERTVSLVTSDKTINSLFDPLSALCAELLAKYREEQRSLGHTTDNVGELIVREGEKESCVVPESGFVQRFRFNDVLFDYVRSSPLITIYGDQDRKRENHTLKLSCRVPRSSGADPFKPLVDEAFRRAAERKHSTGWNQKLFRNAPDGKWVESNPPGSRQLETVVLRGNLRDQIVRDIDDFASHEMFYREIGIPFTRRYLFAGTPRSGKTSLIKALATAKKRHIHYLSLSAVASDDQLMELLNPKNVEYGGTLLVIEDIDCASDAVLDRRILDSRRGSDRKNRTDRDAARRKSAVDWTHDPADAKSSSSSSSSEDGKLKDAASPRGITLAGLLNVLDGVVSTDGQILIATTNHPERLDAALVQPGRFHRRFDFELADSDQFRRLFELFFKRTVATDVLDRFKPGVVSPAEICNQFLCSLEDPDLAVARIVELSHNGSNVASFNAPVKGFSLLPSLPSNSPAPILAKSSDQAADRVQIDDPTPVVKDTAASVESNSMDLFVPQSRATPKVPPQEPVAQEFLSLKQVSV